MARPMARARARARTRAMRTMGCADNQDMGQEGEEGEGEGANEGKGEVVVEGKGQQKATPPPRVAVKANLPRSRMRQNQSDVGKRANFPSDFQINWSTTTNNFRTLESN